MVLAWREKPGSALNWGSQDRFAPPNTSLTHGLHLGLEGTPTTLVPFPARAPHSPNHCREKHGPDEASFRLRGSRSNLSQLLSPPLQEGAVPTVAQ